MIRRRRIPALVDPNVVIRLAESKDEVRLANELVFRNYVAESYWDDNPQVLAENKWLNSVHRHLFIAAYDRAIVGTVSIICDSDLGLPSDSFQPEWTRQFRNSGDRLAEISALAIAKDHPASKNLMFYLMKCYMQYSFYYTSVTRLIKACRPKHANFYADVLRFSKIGGIIYNGYARTPAQFLSIDLFDAHQLLSEYYSSGDEEAPNFYRFFLVDEHPNVRFPEPALVSRSRRRNWSVTRSKKEQVLPDSRPVAVNY